MAGEHELREVSVEERKEECADVAAVHVGVSHDDDAVVAQILDAELLADVRAHGNNQRLDFGVRQHLVQARALDVEDLPTKRQDGLEVSVSALLSAATGGVTLYQEKFRVFGVFTRTVGKLTG